MAYCSMRKVLSFSITGVALKFDKYLMLSQLNCFCKVRNRNLLIDNFSNINS